MIVKNITSWATKRKKPDHDPHGEMNAHLSTFGCDFCDNTGPLPTAVGDDLYRYDENVKIACPECDPDEVVDGDYSLI